jgi:hypothetical protein
MTRPNFPMRAAFFMTLCAVASARAETLYYTINWQSGLSLGEASISSSRTGAAGQANPEPESSSTPSAPAPLASAGDGGWTFQLTLDAAVPGFIIRDEYKSKTDSKFCMQELEKTVQRGSKKVSEKSTFDPKRKVITRETQNGGGKSEMDAADCAHDALAFLQFMRDELVQGRLVPHQSIYLGSKYDLQLTYVGNDVVKLGDNRVEADQIRVSSHGPKSDLTFDVYFAKDDHRTPLMARLPLSLGTFTVELTR